MSLIIETIRDFLPLKRKTTPSGWISFNAPCCNDQRQRGGMIFNVEDGASYHCFNCGFKASWKPGWLVSYNMQKFMEFLGIPDDVITKLRFEAFRLNESDASEYKSIIPKFEPRELPEGAKSLEEWSTWVELQGWENADQSLIDAFCYIRNVRGIDPYSYTFYWSSKIGYKNRLIIPFYKDDVCVGYTARALNDAKPKYLSDQQPGYVFNLDRQTRDRNFVIVSEGPFDAISIDGCAILGAEIKDSQNYLLKQLGKEIILVPDRDHEGLRTVEQALGYGWSVSMPEWPPGVKDINDAVVKLGKLATLYLILHATSSSKLKTRLRAKKWFKENNEETN